MTGGTPKVLYVVPSAHGPPKLGISPIYLSIQTAIEFLPSTKKMPTYLTTQNNSSATQGGI